MKVLVTGHDGYIGTCLVPMLEKAGHKVVGLDNYLFEDCVLGQKPNDPMSHRLDIRDVRTEHLQGLDAVIHLAGISNDPLGDLNPQCTYDINHLASVHLARIQSGAATTMELPAEAF